MYKSNSGNVNMKQVRDDFDQIAQLNDENWDFNKNIYNVLIKEIPETCERILDVGCGKGDFCIKLNNKAQEIIGIDISPKMIEQAIQRSKPFINIKYQIGNYLETKFEEESFDCIVSIATVHHIPFEVFIKKVKKELKSNGRLVVLDIYRTKTFEDFVMSLLSFPLSKLYKLIYNQKITESKKYRAIWKKHCNEDVYLTIKEVKEYCQNYLPDSRIQRHLFWRYSLIWTKKHIRPTMSTELSFSRFF